MLKYADLSGCSGVAAYEYGQRYIKLKFSSGAVYLYSYESAGAEEVECMKLLADRGYGLNSFLNRYARMGYALYVKDST